LKLNSRRVLTAAAGVLTAAALALLIWDTHRLPATVYEAPGPGGWPRIVFVLLFAAAVYLAIDGWRSRDETPVFGSGTGLAVGLMALGFLYLVAIEPVGFLLSTALFLLSSMLLLGLRSIPLLTAVTVGFPLVVYLVFVQLAHTTFPAGLLAPLLGS
jgi:putative tricarboxylic transport membrane protein